MTICPVCGADLSKFEPELTYLKEVGLLEIPEDQRIQYVYGVIESLAESLEKIKNQQGIIQQAALAKQLFQELQQNGPEIIYALLYAVKPEFRPAFYNLLEKVATTNLNISKVIK